MLPQLSPRQRSPRSFPHTLNIPRTPYDEKHAKANARSPAGPSKAMKRQLLQSCVLSLAQSQNMTMHLAQELLVAQQSDVQANERLKKCTEHSVSESEGDALPDIDSNHSLHEAERCIWDNELERRTALLKRLDADLAQRNIELMQREADLCRREAEVLRHERGPAFPRSPRSIYYSPQGCTSSPRSTATPLSRPKSAFPRPGYGMSERCNIVMQSF